MSIRVQEHAPPYRIPRTEPRKRRVVTEKQYFELDGRWEFDRGILEKVSVPNNPHQKLIRFLHEALRKVHANGYSMFPGTRIQLWRAKYRDPDLTFFLRSTVAAKDRERYMETPDWVLEVASDNARDRKRDFVTKRAEYEKAGIPEYWIVDPKEERVHVLTLENGEYHETVYLSSETAASKRLKGFSVKVRELFQAGETWK